MKKQLQRIIPLIVSVALIIALISYTPWGSVESVLDKLKWPTIAILFGLSFTYYGLKTVRFWYMLKAMNIHEDFKLVALSYMSAQPVTLLPAGEIYRSHMLERHTGVPVRKSLPQFTMQGILEGAGMAIVGVICALTLGTLRIPVIMLAVVMLTVVIGIKMGLLTAFLNPLNRIPFININSKRLENFSKDNQTMLSRHWLPVLLSLSVGTEVVGAVIAYVAVTGLGGTLNAYQAGLVYIIPLLLGFISFLPGGFGVSEQSGVGLLLLTGTTVAVAVAATLLIRVSVVGMVLVFGVIAVIISRVVLHRYPLAVTPTPQ